MTNIFYYKFKVRYNETDQMGRVYYSNYLIWFEIARGDIFRKIGSSYKELEEKGYFLPVSKSYAHYLAPSFYDDELVIETKIEYIKKFSIKFSYKIYKENNVINKGYTIHACIDKSGKLKKIPEKLLKEVNI